MLGFAMFGTNDLESSAKFYDAILLPLGIVRTINTERYIGYAKKNKKDIKLYITKPYNKERATNGNGTMIALLTESRVIVDKFHSAALDIGGSNEGLPGLRDDNNYYAYIRDPSGNKICVYSTSEI
jgi:catechol 2,3-dioxygenase-like lactoylglutathione lyase family enzyme